MHVKGGRTATKRGRTKRSLAVNKEIRSVEGKQERTTTKSCSVEEKTRGRRQMQESMREESQNNRKHKEYSIIDRTNEATRKQQAREESERIERKNEVRNSRKHKEYNTIERTKETTRKTTLW